MPDNSKMPNKQDKPKNPSPNPNNPKNRNDPQRSRTTIIMVVLFVLVALFIGSQIMSMNAGNTTDSLETSEFVEAVEQDRVETVVYGGKRLHGHRQVLPRVHRRRRRVRRLQRGLRRHKHAAGADAQRRRASGWPPSAPRRSRRATWGPSTTTPASTWGPTPSARCCRAIPASTTR